MTKNELDLVIKICNYAGLELVADPSTRERLCFWDTINETSFTFYYKTETLQNLIQRIMIRSEELGYHKGKIEIQYEIKQILGF